MNRALEALLADGTPTAEALDAFFAEHAAPLVDGTEVTFVYRGEATGVFLHHWIFGLESAQPFERVDGTDLWLLTEDVPADSRIEYKIEVEHVDGSRLIRDPLNPHLARDPFGANSVLRSAGYVDPEWTRPDPESRPGELVTRVIRSEAFGRRRRFRVYLPARYNVRRRYPLLIVHDGDDYLRFSAMQTVLDNLIHRMEIPPMIVAFSNPGDRLIEYANHEPHARHIVEELLPALEDEFPIVAAEAARGLMGASFGAVATLSTAWRYPGTFGRLLLQSGSFAFTDIGRNRRGPAFEPVVSFVNAFRHAPGRPAARLFVSCGVYESLIYENRSLVPLLQQSGMRVRFVEARDGHNWENWRDRLQAGLSWAFPGPLWMIYE